MNLLQKVKEYFGISKPKPKPRMKPGVLGPKIKRFIQFRLTSLPRATFTAATVVAWLSGEESFAFGRQDPKQAVGRHLSALVKDGTIQIVKTGRKGSPTVYRVAQPKVVTVPGPSTALDRPEDFADDEPPQDVGVET